MKYYIFGFIFLIKYFLKNKLPYEIKNIFDSLFQKKYLRFQNYEIRTYFESFHNGGGRVIF